MLKVCNGFFNSAWIPLGGHWNGIHLPLLNRLRTEITILVDTPVITEFPTGGEAQGIVYPTLISMAESVQGLMLALLRQIIRVRDAYPIRSATSRAPLAFWQGMA